MTDSLRLRATYADGKLVLERPLPELEGLELAVEVRLPEVASRQAEILVDARLSGLSVRLGRELAALGQGEAAPLVKHVRAFRARLEKASGFVLPRVRIVVSGDLPPRGYAIYVRGRCVGEGSLVPGRLLAVAQDERDRKQLAALAREVQPDPIFGLPSAWIGHGMENLARKLGCTLAAADAVLAGHVEEAFSRNLGDCLQPAGMRLILERAGKECPGLLERVVPERVSERDLHTLLAALLQARRRIAPIREVLRAVAEAPPGSVEELVRHVRDRMPPFGQV